MTLLLIAATAGLIYLLQSILYQKYWDKNLDAELSFPKEPAHEGDTAILTEVITNQKIFPLPILQIKFQIDRSLRFVSGKNVEVSDMCYKNDIFSLLFFQKITRKLPFICTKRGYFSIRRVDFVASNLFLTGNLVKQFSVDTSFYVYPKRIPSERLDFLFQRMVGSLVTRRCTVPDPFEFRTIRDYQLQDPQKSINWKASARTSSLKVNVHEYTAGQEMRILLNLEDMTNWKEYRLLEESIRLAAAISSRLLSAGIPVGIISNAPDCETGELSQISVSGGSLQSIKILQYLSRLDYNPAVSSFAEVIHQEEKQMRGSSPCFLVISYSTQPATREAIQKLSATYPGVQWLLPYMEKTTPPITHFGDVELYPWEVKQDA